MKVKMYLYPSYVALGSAESYSPRLFQFLEEQGVELEGVPWDGTLEGLPTGEPVIIRSSSRMHCSPAALAQRCEQLGHLAYYDDNLILPTGDHTHEGLLDATARFLERVRSYQPKAEEPAPVKIKRAPLPFLTTHLANVALNKQIGLVFVSQEAQETCGLNEVSHESLVSDQLHVGSWMIKSFLPYAVANDEEASPVDVWMEFEPFDLTCGIEGLMNIDKTGIERCKEVAEQIEAERAAFGDQLWKLDHQPSVNFLRKIVAQVEECIAYTAKRVEAIKMCAQMDTSSPDAMLRSLMSRGPEMGADLLSGFGGMLGAVGVGPLGYLGIKNMITPPMVFSRRFIAVVRRVVEVKAIEEGYTRLASE